MNSTSPPRVAIGKLGRPHGVRGEIRLHLFNPASSAVVPGLTAYLQSDAHPPKEVEIESARYANKFVILKLTGIDDRDEIDRFKHDHLALDRDDLPPLEEGEFYHIDLVGAPVYVADTEDGPRPGDADAFGTVDRLFATGANDVLVVARHDGDELFVPLVEHAVSRLDFEGLQVVLQPLEIWTPDDYELDTKGD